MSTCIHLVSK